MKNGLFGVASTAVSGLSNVLIQLLVAVLVGPVAFAEFTLVSTTIILVLGLERSVIGQTDMIRGSHPHDPGAISAAYLFAATALASGLAMLAVAGAFSLGFLTILGTGVALSSVFTLQDAMRFRLLRTSRAGWALSSDLIVLITSTSGVILLNHFGMLAQFAAHTWAAASLTGFLVIAILVRYWPERGHGAPWISSNRDVMIPMAVEYGMQSALPYAVNWFLLVVGGHGALAGYRLVQLIFAVLSNFAQGLNAAVLPAIVNSQDPRLAQSRSRLELALLCGSSVLVVTAILLVPNELGAAAFGSAWDAVAVFLIPGALHGVANALSVSRVSMLRLIGLAKYSLYVRFWTVALSLLLVIVGVLCLGPVGASWGLAAGAMVGYLARMIKSRKSILILIQQGGRLSDLNKFR